MPWVKIDADLQSHRKILAVGPWGELLYVRAIGYSRLHLTDGLIDHRALCLLTVDFDPSIASAISDQMVAADLFEPSGKGFKIHDYAVWNQTRKEVERTSLKRKLAGRLGGIAKGWQSAKHGARGLLKQKSSREEKSRGDKSISKSPTPPAGKEDGFEAFWNAYPRKVKKPDALKAWKQTAPVRPSLETLLSSIAEQKNTHQWLKEAGEFIPYPASWLRGHRWDDQPPEDDGEELPPIWEPGEWERLTKDRKDPQAT